MNCIDNTLTTQGLIIDIRKSSTAVIKDKQKIIDFIKKFKELKEKEYKNKHVIFKIDKNNILVSLQSMKEIEETINSFSSLPFFRVYKNFVNKQKIKIDLYYFKHLVGKC